MWRRATRRPGTSACGSADRCVSAGYRDMVRKDPQSRDPRAPAVAIWTVTGVLLGLAFGIVVGGGPRVPVLVGAILGLLLGLYITRTKPGPIDDE